MASLPPIDWENNVNHAPHLVLLGAGASRASLPNGDINGKHIPVMNDLAEITEISSILRDANFSSQEVDFEVIYSQIINSRKEELARAIETKIYHYFKTLKLPEEPTIYDYILLSLREKDAIATFNWDPFLMQAYRRNSIIKKLPEIIFLHGNVMVGACEIDRTAGFTDCACSMCGRRFKPGKLLYPITDKNYTNDPFIRSEWIRFNNLVKYAYIFTIFGYSAPKSDTEARNAMLQTWKSNPYLEQAEIEIIDIKSEKEVMEQWKEFPRSRHYSVWEDISDCYFMNHPRRSCEAFAGAHLQNAPWHKNRFPDFKTLQEMHNWIQPLLKDEIAYSKNKKSFTYKATNFL